MIILKGKRVISTPGCPEQDRSHPGEVLSCYGERLCSRSSHSALWQCDQVRRKRLFVFVVVPDVSVGSTLLTRSLLT